MKGSRAELLDREPPSDARGETARVLVIEPIARRPFPWWDAWAEAFLTAGGRADGWRFRADLPDRLRLLDRAAGLDHRELTGRSLWLDGASGTARGPDLPAPAGPIP